MTGTLGDMKTRIADEIARADLTTQIGNAIDDAIGVYQGERLRFNETFNATFTTSSGQQEYTAVSDPNLSDITSVQQFISIDWLNIQIGATVYELDRLQPNEIIQLTQIGTQSGQPTDYAVDNDTILVYPVPNTTYTMTMGGHLSYGAPTSDTVTNNRWMTDAERLIRARAKYELAVHVTKDDTEAQRMFIAAASAFKELKGEANSIQGTGRIRPMQF